MKLNLDEIILKEILPKKSFFFNSTERLRIPFSFFYLIIMILIFINFSGFFLVFGILFLVAGFYYSFGRWIFKYFELKNNKYIITNQRIIIVENQTGYIYKFLKLDNIKIVNIEMNNNFFGNIIFGEPEMALNFEKFVFRRSFGMNFNEDEFSFQSVENINEIIPIFEKLNLKISKTFY